MSNQIKWVWRQETNVNFASFSANSVLDSDMECCSSANRNANRMSAFFQCIISDSLANGHLSELFLLNVLFLFFSQKELCVSGIERGMTWTIHNRHDLRCMWKVCNIHWNYEWKYGTGICALLHSSRAHSCQLFIMSVRVVSTINYFILLFHVAVNMEINERAQTLHTLSNTRLSE